MSHDSTTEQRVRLVSELIAHDGKYGVVSQSSQSHAISRQTLYIWKRRAEQALKETFDQKEGATQKELQIERAVLTLLTEGHSSYRGIQNCLEELLGIHVSLGKISAIVQQAGEAAMEWLERQVPAGKRALALDEQYSSQRGEAYLNVVDVHSGLVLATVPPVGVDGESWELLLLDMGERGIEWKTAVSDGGRAISSGVQQVAQADQVFQRDTWHVLNECGKVQHRLDRVVEQWKEQAPAVQRQADRVAAGKKPRGTNPKIDVEAHAALIKRGEYVASSLRYLSHQLQLLLGVVVLSYAGACSVLCSHQRQQELQTLLLLLEELAEQAPGAMQEELKKLLRHLCLAAPHLLCFAPDLDDVQNQVREHLGPAALHLIAWAWLHRDVLGKRSVLDLHDFPPPWREWAQKLICAWEQAVRASSCVENWHSVLRPFLAVHHQLSAGMLALLAVWHNHRVAPRGLHLGQSALQRAGLQSQPADWLCSLGYPPRSALPLAA
jgi:hypothetical protein